MRIGMVELSAQGRKQLAGTSGCCVSEGRELPDSFI